MHLTIIGKAETLCTVSERIKSIISKKIIVFVIKKADRVKLLYNVQLEPLNIGTAIDRKISVFGILLLFQNFVMKM